MSRERHAVAADIVFDGTHRHADAAVVIEGGDVVALTARSALPPGMPRRTLPKGAWLAPGFIDIQVNGGGDLLFNDDSSPETIATIAAAHRKFGTTGFLPTLITDTDEKMRAAIAVVAESREPAVLGIHLEGPFLSPERPGVHRKDLIRRPEPHHLDMLASLSRGVTLVTLAPEEVPQGFVAALAGKGVRVSLGHSMATYRQTLAAMADGLTGFTHLFNAMRPLDSREPGPIAAALERGAFCGMIVDGFHVDPAMLRLALRAGCRPILVTDAMPTVGGRATAFSLQGRPIALKDGRLTDRDGRLAGAALDMAGAVRNGVKLLGVPLEAALRYAYAEPAAFLGIETLGHLRPGARADMVAFHPQPVTVLASWVAGEEGPGEPGLK